MARTPGSPGPYSDSVWCGECPVCREDVWMLVEASYPSTPANWQLSVDFHVANHHPRA